VKINLETKEVKSFFFGKKYQICIQVALDPEEQAAAKKHRVFVISPDDLARYFPPRTAVKLLALPMPFINAFERGVKFTFNTADDLVTFENLFKIGIQRWKRETEALVEAQANAQKSVGKSESFSV